MEYNNNKPRRPDSLFFSESSSLTIDSPDLKKIAISTPELDSLVEKMEPFSTSENLKLLDHTILSPIWDPLEIKRWKNRMAANRCRRKKEETISRLQAKKTYLIQTKYEMLQYADTLRNEINGLQNEIRTHINFGCKI